MLSGVRRGSMEANVEPVALGTASDSGFQPPGANIETKYAHGIAKCF